MNLWLVLAFYRLHKLIFYVLVSTVIFPVYMTILVYPLIYSILSRIALVFVQNGSTCRLRPLFRLVLGLCLHSVIKKKLATTFFVSNVLSNMHYKWQTNVRLWKQIES